MTENRYTCEYQLGGREKMKNSCVKVVRLRCGVSKDTNPRDVIQVHT